jgi:hypothetical protein
MWIGLQTLSAGMINTCATIRRLPAPIGSQRPKDGSNISVRNLPAWRVSLQIRSVCSPSALSCSKSEYSVGQSSYRSPHVLASESTPVDLVGREYFAIQGNIMNNDSKVAGAREDDVTGMIESDVANSVHGLFERGTRLNGGCSDIENGRQETRFSVCGTVGCTVVADGRFFRGRSATA